MTVDEQTLIDFITGQRWFGSKTRHVTHATLIDRAVLRETDPALELQIVETRFDTGTHETYQLLADGGLDALGDPRQVRELVHMIRGGRQAAGRRGRRRVRGGGRLRGARQRAARSAPDQRRAVEHVGRVRRRADPQGLPAPRGGHQSRARAAPLPDRARLREHRAARRLVRLHRAADGRDARHPAALRRERPGRLGARARHAGGRGVPDEPAPARRGDRADAHAARQRLERPELLSRATVERVAGSADRDDRRRDRGDLRRASRHRRRRARFAAAARRCASACAC